MIFHCHIFRDFKLKMPGRHAAFFQYAFQVHAIGTLVRQQQYRVSVRVFFQMTEVIIVINQANPAFAFGNIFNDCPVFVLGFANAIGFQAA